MMDERIITAERANDDEGVDHAIRPRLLKDYSGQPGASEQLDIFIPAARNRGEALDHLLILGLPV